MFTQLENQWFLWSQSLTARKVFAVWDDAHPDVFAGWDVESLREPQGSYRTDRMQAALVSLSQHGDQDAISTLTVQLLPGLRKLVRTYGPRGQTSQEVLSFFYETLVRHKLEKRPRKIAANLLLDTKNKLYRQNLRVEKEQDKSEQGFAADSFENSVVERICLHNDFKKAIDSQSSKQRQTTALLAFGKWVMGEDIATLAQRHQLSATATATKLWRLKTAVRQIAAA